MLLIDCFMLLSSINRVFYNMSISDVIYKSRCNIMEVLRNIFQRIFHRWADDPKNQQFFVKMLFAVFSAIICSVCGRAFAGIRGLMFGILIYILTLFIIVYLLEIDPETLGGRVNLIKDTLFSYLLLWVLLWTLFYPFFIPQYLLDELIIMISTTPIS